MKPYSRMDPGGLAANAGRGQARRRRVGAIALGCAALLAFLSVAAGTLHKHGGDAGAVQIDCRACAWTHAAAAGLGHAPPGFSGLDDASAFPAENQHDSSNPALTERSTRGPPSLSR